VNEFKFRVLDLVGTFVECTKNPEQMHANLPQLAKVILTLHRDRSQTLYVQRYIT
jgi:hypothetical protein